MNRYRHEAVTLNIIIQTDEVSCSLKLKYSVWTNFPGCENDFVASLFSEKEISTIITIISKLILIQYCSYVHVQLTGKIKLTYLMYLLL